MINLTSQNFGIRIKKLERHYVFLSQKVQKLTFKILTY